MVVHRSSTADSDVQLTEELNDLGNIFDVSTYCGEPHLCGQLPINRRQNRFILL
jgi:hypothetical protein